MSNNVVFYFTTPTLYALYTVYKVYAIHFAHKRLRNPYSHHLMEVNTSIYTETELQRRDPARAQPPVAS